eukprot:3552527-Rhodomonas_salina.3
MSSVCPVLSSLTSKRNRDRIFPTDSNALKVTRSVCVLVLESHGPSRPFSGSTMTVAEDWPGIDTGCKMKFASLTPSFTISM